MTQNPPLSLVLYRGLRLKCPRCGVGQLFRAYLKPVDTCSFCGDPLGHIRADDGPAWLTILITGHIIGPGLVLTQMRGLLSVWQGAAVWLTTAIIITFCLLPRAKGVFIALLWKTEGTKRE